MASENAEVVRRQFAAFGAGGLDAVAQYWHPDVEWRAVEGAVDDVGIMRGHDALRRYYSDWIETIDDLRSEVTDVVYDSGEIVAVVLRHWGRMHGSNVPIEGRYSVVCTVRAGQIVSGREYETTEQALTAVDRTTGFR